MAFLLGVRLAGAAAPQTAGLASTAPLLPQARLLPADVARGDGFGGPFGSRVMSADGRTLLLSAHFQNCAAGLDCGAVYVFALVQGVWTQQAKLTLSDAAANDVFGSEMALSANGDIALIGDFSRDCGLGLNCGEAYVFERSGGIWNGGVKIDSPSLQKGAYFGSSVGLSGAGDVAVVGASLQFCPSPPGGFSCGAAFVFRRTGGTWSLEATLRSPFASEQFFGALVKVARDGTIVLVQGAIDGGTNSGAIFVFREEGGIWGLEAKIFPPVPTLLDFPLVALSGDGQTAVAAAIPTEDGVPLNRPLSYYVYVRNAGVWTQQGPPLPPMFGSGSAGLSFDGDTVIVGLQSGGKAQLFGRSGGAWSLLQELTPAEPGAAGSTTRVALSDDGRTALVHLPEVDCVDGVICRGVAFVFAAAAPLPAVPTLSELGLALLALLIAGTGAVLLRRRAA